MSTIKGLNCESVVIHLFIPLFECSFSHNTRFIYGDDQPELYSKMLPTRRHSCIHLCIIFQTEWLLIKDFPCTPYPLSVLRKKYVVRTRIKQQRTRRIGENNAFVKYIHI